MEKNTDFLQSKTAKLFMVGLITVILLLPLQWVKMLIEERADRQSEVVYEVSEKWGEDIYIYGPILKIPYQTLTQQTLTDPKTNATVKQWIKKTHYAYFFPDELITEADVKMQKPLKRGIYQSNVFSASFDSKGFFGQPDFSGQDIQEEHILWDQATLLIRTTNQKRLTGQVQMKWGENTYRFEPTAVTQSHDGTTTLESEEINLENLKTNAKESFAFQLAFNGSHSVRLAPIGKTTKTTMTSNWHSPSFMGNFLPSPENKQLSAQGFNVQWEVLHYNRPFAQRSFEQIQQVESYAYGVDFITPVDQYQQNERASKYGFLVIGLTFLIFFLIQNVSKIDIHIFQYMMIGLALVMFYTLLISITEHSSFLKAYLIAGSSVVVLITLYSKSILKNLKFPLLIGASLTALYTFIFVIIQLEDYALLTGSIGLFIILAAVMYFSRKIDWTPKE